MFAKFPGTPLNYEVVVLIFCSMFRDCLSVIHMLNFAIILPQKCPPVFKSSHLKSLPSFRETFLNTETLNTVLNIVLILRNFFKKQQQQQLTGWLTVHHYN